MKKFYTSKEAAKLFVVTPTTITRWVRSGWLDAHIDAKSRTFHVTSASITLLLEKRGLPPLGADGRTGKQRGSQRLCKLPGCKRPRYSLGFCRRHGDHYKRNGDPNAFRTKAFRCRLSGCDVVDLPYQGLCTEHLESLQAAFVAHRCFIDACEAAPMTSGLCAKHDEEFLFAHQSRVIPGGCLVEECDGPLDPTCCFCAEHKAWWTSLKLDRRRGFKTERCLLPSCRSETHASGICNVHRFRAERRGGLPPRDVVVLICAAPRCKAKGDKAGLCAKHYARAARLNFDAMRTGQTKCKIKECNAAVSGGGMCSAHLTEIAAVRPDAHKAKNCAVPVCRKREQEGQLCKDHLAKFHSSLDVDMRRSKHGACLVRGCRVERSNAGLCAAHLNSLADA